MSGKPAARLGDAVAGGKIVQGSATVLIGSQGGIACSACPGGMAVGSPVNPALGAKVLLGGADLDFSLPGALPLAWQRQYSSYVNRQHGGRCGLLGYGWSLPFEFHIDLAADACRLFDTGGRVIAFDPIAAGEALYSPSEDLWLLRGGPELGSSGNRLPWQRQPRWRHVPEQWRRSADCLIAGRPNRPVWGFGRKGDGRFVVYQLIDPLGRRQSYLRDDAGQLTGVVDGSGRRYRFEVQALYDPKPAQAGWQADSGIRLLAVTLLDDPHAPLEQPIPLVRYQYSPQGDLVGVVDRSGAAVREFAYRHHRLVFHRDRGGPEHHYVYENDDAGARVVEQRNQDGLNYRFDYLDAENSVVVSDSLGRRDRYRFRGAGGLKRLVEHTRADGTTVGYRYDRAGRLAAETDPLGRTRQTHWDDEGRVVGMSNADGTRSELVWDRERGLLLETRSPGGATLRLRYDEFGRLSERIDPENNVTGFRYPDPARLPLAADRPNEIIDAKGGIKKLHWSDSGLLLAYTDCSGRTSRFRYDRWGQLLESVDPLGHVTVREWDARGLPVAIVSADGHRQHYAYDSRGYLLEYRDGQGKRIDFTYDRQGRLTGRGQGGRTIALEYDPAGRPTVLLNENQSAVRFVYDVLDRPIREIGFDGRTRDYRYDAAGQLIEIVDGNAGQFRTTGYEYDRAGQIVRRTVDQTDAAPGESHRYRYDRDGELLAVIAETRPADPAAALKLAEIRIERDRNGRPLSETQLLYREGQIEFCYRQTHAYDALGNRQASELADLGELQWLSYGSGHLHGLTLNRQPLLDFERDAGHRIIEQRWPNGLVEHRRLDPLGRPVGLRLTGAGNTPLQELRLRYDPAGQLSELSLDGRSIAYRYDPAGRLIGMSDDRGERRWRFDPAGNRLPEPLPATAGPALAAWQERVLANLDNPEFNLLGQDPGQRDRREHAVGAWKYNRIGYTAGIRYRYDVWGNRSEAEYPDGSRLRFSYDGLHRLVAVVRCAADGRESQRVGYRYDPFNRRQAKTVVSGDLSTTVRYGWDDDRLTRIDDGRTVRHAVYPPGEFIPLVELVGAKETPAAPAADDREDAATALEQIPASIRDALIEPLVASAGAGLAERIETLVPDFARPAAERVFGEIRARRDRPAAAVEVRYYHCDHLGTPVALSDRQGRIIWQGRYDPWGALLEEFNPEGIDQPIRFQGQHFDAETGLHYNRHRYYDPATGSYISQDPIGLAGGINPYAYPLNPLIGIDPLGLKSCTGSARVLQGNSRLIGKGGGYDTGPSNLEEYGVTKDSAAIIPSQWGLGNKKDARKKINKISGKLASGTEFTCVRDILDDKALRDKGVDPQKKLMDANPGKLVLELPGIDKDQGIQDVTLDIPDDMDCPDGTK